MMTHYKEHIYSLEDRNESDISRLWQFLQVLFFTLCIVLGFTVCFTFGHVMSSMQYNCILYANLSFNLHFTEDSIEVPNNIKTISSEFHSIYCELVLYVPVVTSTFACFFTVMFAYCGRGGAGNQSMQETWRIIMPTVFFNFTCLCLTAYTAHIFQSGLKAFLRSVAAAWGTHSITLAEIGHLRLDGTTIGGDVITYGSLTKYAAWLLPCFWGLNFFWILLRILFNVDFQLVRTTIHVYPKLREEGKHSSASDTSVNSSFDSNSQSVRLRTVKFSPSTEGAVRTAQLRKKPSLGSFSAEPVEKSLEIEIADVYYDRK